MAMFFLIILVPAGGALIVFFILWATGSVRIEPSLNGSIKAEDGIERIDGQIVTLALLYFIRFFLKSYWLSSVASVRNFLKFQIMHFNFLFNINYCDYWRIFVYG